MPSINDTTELKDLTRFTEILKRENIQLWKRAIQQLSPNSKPHVVTPIPLTRHHD